MFPKTEVQESVFPPGAVSVSALLPYDPQHSEVKTDPLPQ